jgi:hypothetical protein
MQSKITDFIDKKDGQLLDRESDLAVGNDGRLQLDLYDSNVGVTSDKCRRRK